MYKAKTKKNQNSAMNKKSEHEQSKPLFFLVELVGKKGGKMMTTTMLLNHRDLGRGWWRAMMMRRGESREAIFFFPSPRRFITRNLSSPSSYSRLFLSLFLFICPFTTTTTTVHPFFCVQDAAPSMILFRGGSCPPAKAAGRAFPRKIKKEKKKKKNF